MNGEAKPTVRYYSDEELLVILEKADRLGLPLQKGSPIEQLTISELELLVSRIGEA